MGKNKKEKLIQNEGEMKYSKVKSYEENKDQINKNIVSKGNDIKYNKL